MTLNAKPMLISSTLGCTDCRDSSRVCKHEYTGTGAAGSLANKPHTSAFIEKTAED